MANKEHIDLLKQGVDIWNHWREEYPVISPDLCGANLRGIDLRNANLKKADLRQADLDLADLRSANLRGASLGKTTFVRSNLYFTDFTGADLNMAVLNSANLSMAILNFTNLTGASLLSTNLHQADFIKANLFGANLFKANFNASFFQRTDFTQARLGRTIFGEVDLRCVRGLETVHHSRPSTIGIDTLILSGGNIPETFLREAGIPDTFIEYARSLSMHPIQYHSLFISYSSRDDILARRLYADLQVKGVRCWFAPEDMKIGEKFRTRIDEAIHIQEKLLLLLSEHALASDWVEAEVETALEKERRQTREVLFPVRLDDSVMQTTQAWAATLRRSRHIGDFTNWTDPQMYQAAFDRLLRDLKKADREETKDGGN